MVLSDFGSQAEILYCVFMRKERSRTWAKCCKPHANGDQCLDCNDSRRDRHIGKCNESADKKPITGTRWCDKHVRAA